MRAVIMISSFAMAGTERNVVSVTPFIKDQGIDLRLVTMNTRRDSPLAEEFSRNDVPRFDLNAIRMTDTAAWGRFTNMLRKEKIDIIHAQDQDTIIYGALAHRRLGIPTVMSRHVLFEPTDTLKEKMRAQMVLLAAKMGMNRIIAVSEAVRQDFSNMTNIPLERIETIYNGLDMERFKVSEDKAAIRKRLGWDPEIPTIIMVAVLRRGKGHEVLLQAIPKIKASIPNFKIMLVGDGEIADQIRTQAEPYSDVVEFLGQRTDVPDLLAASDVVTLPSWAEALPTVLIEAGAAKRPIVATDVGGAKEITLDGETGYIVDAGDVDTLAKRLILLLNDKEDAKAMGQRAYERVTSIFSLEQQAAQTVDLYKRVLAERA